MNLILKETEDTQLVLYDPTKLVYPMNLVQIYIT